MSTPSAAEAAISAYASSRLCDPSEMPEVSRVLELLTASRTDGGGGWSRSLPLHLTASALVVHPPSGRVLLRWHERLSMWAQVGGHAEEGEEDPVAIAQREAVEETGLVDVEALVVEGRLRHGELVHIAVVGVPASTSRDETEHEHADLRFVLSTASPERCRPESESSPLQWLSFADALDLVVEPNLAVLLGRVRDLVG